MLVMPLVIQVIENDDDRHFMEQLYTDYNRLMYSTAWKYVVSGVEVDDILLRDLQQFAIKEERQ